MFLQHLKVSASECKGKFTKNPARPFIICDADGVFGIPQRLAVDNYPAALVAVVKFGMRTLKHQHNVIHLLV